MEEVTERGGSRGTRLGQGLEQGLKGRDEAEAAVPTGVGGVRWVHARPERREQSLPDVPRDALAGRLPDGEVCASRTGEGEASLDRPGRFPGARDAEDAAPGGDQLGHASTGEDICGIVIVAGDTEPQRPRGVFCGHANFKRESSHAGLPFWAMGRSAGDSVAVQVEEELDILGEELVAQVGCEGDGAFDCEVCA